MVHAFGGSTIDNKFSSWQVHQQKEKQNGKASGFLPLDRSTASSNTSYLKS
jgi:hypothetical protein